MREQGGIECILEILEKRMKSEKIANWKFLKRTVQTIYMFCFDPLTLRALKKKNSVSVLVRTLSKALEERTLAQAR